MYCEDEEEQQQALPALNEHAPDAMVSRTHKWTCPPASSVCHFRPIALVPLSPRNIKRQLLSW